jgi:outer membrane protein assembly factor BamB
LNRVLGLLLAGCLHADWPGYRGPGASGIGSGEPPVSWDAASGRNVRWKTAIPGLAHASPIVHGEQVYVTSAIAAGEQSLKVGMYGSGDSPAESGDCRWELFCIARATGEILWQRTAHSGKPRRKRHMKASHANATPATDGRHIVAMFGSEGLFCYNREGEFLWRVDFGAPHAGPYNAPALEWGCASSPLIHKDAVIVQCDVVKGGFIAVLDLATGKERLRIPRDGEVATWSTPAIWEAGERTQIVCNGYRHIGGYDLLSGKAIWSLRGGGDIPVPTPVIAGNRVFICNAHGRMNPIYAIAAEASGDITPIALKPPPGLAWWSARGGSYIPTPIVIDDALYVAGDRGVLTCYDASTGELRYRQRLANGGSYSASPVAAAGRLYLTAESGQIHVVATGPNFQLLATNDMNEICMATPAIDAGQLFIRTRSQLYCIGE